MGKKMKAKTAKSKVLKVKTSIKATTSNEPIAEQLERNERERNRVRIREAVNHPGWGDFATSWLSECPQPYDVELLLSCFDRWGDTWRVFRSGYDSAEERWNVPNYDLP